MTDPGTLVAEGRAWYDGYFQVFTRLGRGERSDLDALADLFATPTTLVTDDRCLTIAARAVLLRVLGDQVAQLRRAGYARRDTHRLEGRARNARAALIEGTCSRHDGQGREDARLGAAYLVIRTEAGWRFAALIVTPPA
ncbi:MAG: DUF6841 family protein [Chloroflexota bacterium]